MQPRISSLPQAVAVLDLALAGVVAELGEEPFDWLSKEPRNPGTKEPREGAKDEGKPAGDLGRTVVPLVVPQTVEKAVARVEKEVEAVAVAGEVWVEGDKGGVVLVVQGERPDGRMVQLAKAMLAAVGLAQEPLGWVGVDGKVEKEALVAALEGFPNILVMGQGPLGVLLGRNLGVEGWQAAGGVDLGLAGRVGVTYPLELLLKQPLFKRLAWQHVQVWKEGM